MANQIIIFCYYFIIGMAEFTYMYDVKEKPTSDMTIFSNSEQDWICDDVWDIQIY